MEGVSAELLSEDASMPQRAACPRRIRARVAVCLLELVGCVHRQLWQ